MTIFYCWFGEDIIKFENKVDWQSSYWEDIKEAIISYINASCPDKHCTNIIPILPKKTKNCYDWEVGFDHQTYPTYLEDCVVNLYEPEEVVNFIFNKNMALQTNCD